MLHIAFAKGRIAKTVMKNLAAAGFNFPHTTMTAGNSFSPMKQAC